MPLIDGTPIKENEFHPSKLRTPQLISSKLESMRAADVRFDQLQQLRYIFENLLDTHATLLHIKRRRFFVNTLGDLRETVSRLKGTVLWDDSLEPDPHFTPEQLSQSIYNLGGNSPEEKYWQQVCDFVDTQLPQMERYLQDANQKVTQLSSELSSTFKETQTFIPLIIDELLAEFNIDITAEQKQRIELFVINNDTGWRIYTYLIENEKTPTSLSALSNQVPAYFLLTAEDLVEDIDTLKHEVMHRLKAIGVTSEDIKIPIATAAGFLENLLNSPESQWSSLTTSVDQDFVNQLVAEIKLYDLDVIYVYFVMNEGLFDLAEAPKVIQARKNTRFEEAEPFFTYEEGKRLAVMAMILGRLSAETSNPITPQKFLSELAKGKLPSEVYSFT